MKLSLVFLLVVSFGVVVQTIKLDLLSSIVKKFQGAAGIHAAKNKVKQPNQISFILFIPDCESSNSLQDIGLGVKDVYRLELDKFHDWFKQHPSDKPYYLLTYPYNRRCSEYHILFNNVQNELPTPPTYAEWIAKVSKDGGVRPDGSCIIFYTTNTPCTNKCFNDANNRRYIVDKLLDEPFNSWKEGGAKLIFAFMKVYDNDDNDNNKFEIIKTCFKKLVPKWEIYNCIQDQNQHSCKSCSDTDDFKNCGLQQSTAEKRPSSSKDAPNISEKKRKIN